MIKEDKKLLLTDLCARLHYELIVSPSDCGNARLVGCLLDSVLIQDIRTGEDYDKPWDIEYVRPYLRPMSSMTEEEKLYLKLNYGFELHGDVLSNLHIIKGGGYYEREGEYVEPTEDRQYTHITIDTVSELIKWLNAHHFDYRGLIERGLAIAVTEENNPYKE